LTEIVIRTIERGTMATPTPKELPQVIQMFKVIEQREALREAQEAAIREQAAVLEAQRQEVEDLRAEKQGLMTVIRELMAQLEDLTAEVPAKAHALELRLTETRQAVADEAAQLGRIQAHQQSVQQQISDAEGTLRDLKAQIMGGEQMARARGIFTPPPAWPSLRGPAIIQTAPDYDPLTVDDPREEASA
jgi:hypothetical protein